MGTLRPVSDEWVENIAAIDGSSLRFVVGTDAQVEDAGSLLTTHRKKKKVLVEFERDDDDAPVLEDPSRMMARVMEPMVRQFLTIYYGKSIEGDRPTCFIFCPFR